MTTGTEVRIKSKNDTFITTIDEVTGDDTFTILAPYKGGQLIAVFPKETFSVSCVTDRGLYMFDAIVTDVDTATNVTIIHLKITGEIRRVQRRQAFRVRENITVTARKLADENSPAGKWVKTNTIDVGERGVLLRFDEYCEYGQTLEMTLRISVYGINTVISKVKGTVMRCFPTRNKEFGFLLGIRFDDLPEKARDALIKLVVLSQRDKLTYNNEKKFR